MAERETASRVLALRLRREEINLKALKRIAAILLGMLLLIVLAFIGGIAFLYYTTDSSVVPAPAVRAAERELLPDSYSWNQPLMQGLTFKEFQQPYANQCVELGELDALPLELPSREYASRITVTFGEQQSLFEGSAQEYQGFHYQEPGRYQVDVELSLPEKKEQGWGSFHYRAAFTLPEPPPPPEPELLQSARQVAQGDALALLLRNAPEGAVPTAETEVCKVTFARRGADWIAYVPVSYLREPGDCTVSVTCGEDFSQQVEFQVTEGDFEVQNLTIDVSDPVISEANSPAAYQQYRDAIYPLYETADPEIYWDGPFIEPLDSYRISTTYGIKRYTNGGATPSRHAGTDMAAGTGTPVKAPGAGRVVFAQYLLNTGNTVAIEHGAGMKTFYFHMNSLEVAEGDLVRQGQQIGTVGTTGYSTGPHLHFELRVANQAVDPFLMIRGEGGFFALDGEASTGQ